VANGAKRGKKSEARRTVRIDATTLPTLPTPVRFEPTVGDVVAAFGASVLAVEPERTEVLGIKEAAARLGVRAETVARWARQGRINARRVVGRLRVVVAFFPLWGWEPARAS
jgi:excisionase family DNA binding protein